MFLALATAKVALRDRHLPSSQPGRTPPPDCVCQQRQNSPACTSRPVRNTKLRSEQRRMQQGLRRPWHLGHASLIQAKSWLSPTLKAELTRFPLLDFQQALRLTARHHRRIMQRVSGYCQGTGTRLGSAARSRQHSNAVVSAERTGLLTLFGNSSTRCTRSSSKKMSTLWLTQARRKDSSEIDRASSTP